MLKDSITCPSLSTVALTDSLETRCAYHSCRLRNVCLSVCLRPLESILGHRVYEGVIVSREIVEWIKILKYPEKLQMTLEMSR